MVEMACPMCLGAIECSHNLCEPSSRKLLDLLHQVLGFQVDVIDKKFLVCSKCVDKLTWISEFQDSCQKCYEKFRITKCKEEMTEPDTFQLLELTLDANDEDLSFESRNGNNFDFEGDSDCNSKKKKQLRKTTNKSKVAKSFYKNNSRTRKLRSHETPKTTHLRKNLRSHYKTTLDPIEEELGFESPNSDSDISYKVDIDKNCKEEKQSHESSEKPEEDKACDNNVTITEPSTRKSGYKQFPKEEVLKAIEECTNFITDIKNKTCLYCDVVVSATKLLTVHMKAKHKELFETWCRRCNLQTDNLQVHMASINCFENRCKFCNKKFKNKNIYELTRHLRCHYGVAKPLTRQSVYQQFPKAEVLKAIAECRNYVTDTKNKTCIYCNFIVSAPKLLTMHMRGKHAESFKTWCSRCNLQTDNLKVHMESTNCSKNGCKFCLRTFTKLSTLTRHLQSHCKILIRSEELLHIEDIPNIAENNASSAPSVQCKMEIDSTFDLLELDGQIETETNTFESGRLKHNLKAETLNSDAEQCSAMQCDSIEVSKSCTLQLFDHEEVLKAISGSRRLFQTNWNCAICDFLSSNTSELDSHMTVAHKDERHKWCRICNTIVDDLTKHRSDHRKEQLKCTFCEQKFGGIYHLIYHLKRHSDVYKSGEQLIWFTCKVCLNFYPNAKQLKNHECTGSIECRDETEKRAIKTCEFSPTTDTNAKRRIDNKMDQFPPQEVVNAIKEIFKVYQTNVKCIICDTELVNSRMLSSHMATMHGQVRSTWCNLCNTLVDDLPSHKQGHRYDLLKCKFCGRSFTRLRSLSKHLELHSRLLFDNKEIWYDCDVCPNTYPDVLQLKDHECQGSDPDHNGKKIKIISSIASSTTNLCTICAKTFRTERLLTDHMKFHDRKKKYACSYCDKECDSKPSLLIHVRSHTGERPFLCNICGRGFKSRNNLKTHIQTHSGKKEECTICHKRFCHRSYLKSHMQLHTGEKRFLCNICGWRFLLNGTLVQHMRRHHNYGKPYKCRFCEKDFKTYDLRTYHEDKHRGIKTLRCSKCRYTCKTSHRFATHMKKHSATETKRERRHTCLICHKQFSMKAMLTLHINNQHDEIV